MLAASAFTLSLDAAFVARKVGGFDATRFLWKPIACASLAGGLLVYLDGASPLLRLAAGLATYVFAAFALGLLPRSERAFLRDALRHGLGRSAP